MTAHEIETAFAAALANAGLGTAQIPADGKLHRFKVPGDKGRQRTGWAVLYGDGVPHGVAGNWRTGERVTWKPDGAEQLSAVDQKAVREAMRKREAERKEIQKRIAVKAMELWLRLPPAPENHPYLARKQIPPGPCKVTNTSALVIPVVDVDSGVVTSLQFVRGDGEKRFLAGGRTAGGCCILGEEHPLDHLLPLVIAEGFATASSIRAATGHPVVVAFTAGNLLAVVKGVRAKYPEREIIIAADNDVTTEGNPGLAKAREAAAAMSARLVFPPEGDFNDLALDQGAEAVKEHFISEDEALAKSAAEIIAVENVFDLFAADWCKIVAGEEKVAKLLYLVATSRLFTKTMHAAIKGPSSSGKSEVRTRVLEFFPTEAIVAFTSLSERALIYFEDSFEHKILSMGEASGTDEQTFQDYLLRELMSEGRLVYPTVQKVGANVTTIVIRKDGPVAFLVTTTRRKLHPENETRMLSLEMDDSETQTRAVLAKVAEVEGLNATSGAVNYQKWQDFQRWLEKGERAVVVPFARSLADAVPPRSVRLRRDLGQVIRAIKAHALLHRSHRERDQQGQILADIEHDYAVVRDLMHDLLAETSEVKVKDSTMQTVNAVTHATKDLEADDGATAQAVGKLLKLDRSAAWRRLRTAEDEGLIVNLETRRGKPGRYRATGETREMVEMMPMAEVLATSCPATPLQPVQPATAPANDLEFQEDERLQDRLQPLVQPVLQADPAKSGCKAVANASATANALEFKTNSAAVAGCTGCNGEAGEPDPDDWSTYADESYFEGSGDGLPLDKLKEVARLTPAVDLDAEMPTIALAST
jgi:putative DNA primase/helicase